jgi:hypothetical protein
MIFRSRRRRNEPVDTEPEPTGAETSTEQPLPEQDDPNADGEPAQPGDVSGESVDDLSGTGESATSSAPELTDAEAAAMDAREWREDGPYDIGEVDADELEDPDADPPVIDLGSMVLTPLDGMELRLQVDENSQQIVSAMMIRGDSALEVGPFAAPRSGGLWSEIRSDLVDAAQSSGGSANLVAGPYGVELRRLLPVQTPDGQEGYQPSRMWVAEGPRWMLRGIVYGQAALEDGLDSPVREMLDAFQQVVVRRGDEPMAPGDLLPLKLPENMAQEGGRPAAAQSGDLTS